MKIKLLALILALMLVLTACGASSDSDEKTEKETETQTQEDAPVSEEVQIPDAPKQTIGAVTLTEVGKVSPDAFNGYNTVCLTNYADDYVTIPDLNGQTLSDYQYKCIDSIIGNGLVVVQSKDSGSIPMLGVYNAYTGEQVIPCESAAILMLNDRYLMTCYHTGPAEDYTDGFYFYIDPVSHDTVYFTGYGKIFDLQTGAFVPGLELSSSYLDITAIGDCILIENDEGADDVFNASGTCIGTYKYMNAFPDSDLGLQDLGNGVNVFDGTMTQVSQLEGSVYDYNTIKDCSDKLIKTNIVDGSVLYNIIDLQGNTLSAHFPSIVSVYDEQYILSYTKSGDDYLYGMYNFKGNAIVPAEYKSVTYFEPGYFSARNDAGYFIYDLEGNKINNTPMDGMLQQILFYAGASYDQVLVLSNGNLMDAESYPSVLTLSLAKIDNTIYDVISGSSLFENVDEAFACGDSIYVMLEDEEEYTRYIVAYA